MVTFTSHLDQVVEDPLAEHFAIARRLYTPMRPLGSALNSQAWFVCERRS